MGGTGYGWLPEVSRLSSSCARREGGAGGLPPGLGGVTQSTDVSSLCFMQMPRPQMQEKGSEADGGFLGEAGGRPLWRARLGRLPAEIAGVFLNQVTHWTKTSQLTHCVGIS